MLKKMTRVLFVITALVVGTFSVKSYACASNEGLKRKENITEYRVSSRKIDLNGNPFIAAPTDTKGPVEPMYRLYNPNSGEHFYTAGKSERDGLVSRGWRYEGIGWYAPEGLGSDPVYRLYNPNAGDHHYTMSVKERNYLARHGWNYEGIGWYSGGSIPIYRQYNPNAVTGSHNFTTNRKERDALVRAGWRAEGIAWYGTSG